ncbi:MAG: sigma-70 family RNA polymerase sigma factor [Clostridia bacterium]|nr:sigma-70 family RNA polymerase sigma factor [Clostridia bacterium]
MDNGASSYHRFLQGDNAALEELVREYSDDLVRYAYFYVRNSQTAEDVMEDTFAALIIKRKKFKGEAPFLSYLYKIARNKCMDFLRSKRSHEVPLFDLENVLKCESAENAALKKVRDKEIFACMQKLPKQYFDVLYMTYFHDFSAEDIKRATGKSKKQIYNLLARAKNSLKNIFVMEGIGYEEL